MVESPEFKKVVRRVFELAKEFYNSDVHANIHDIYGRLSDTEQSIFLKGLVTFLFEVDTAPRPITITLTGDDSDYVSEYVIDKFNQIELIKLKSWLVKCVSIVVSIGATLGMFYILATMILPSYDQGALDDFIEFVKVVLNLD